MADFRDLKSRVKYGVPLGVVALACLALVPTTMALIVVLACVFTFEVVRSLADKWTIRLETLLITIAFWVMGCAGFASAAYLRVQENGVYALLLVALGVAATDVFAYWGGKQYGRTPFFPSVSPNKTHEGVMCGLAAGMILMFIGSFWFLHSGYSQPGLIPGFLAFVAVPFVAVAGDLLESKTKRLVGIKDFGRSLGAHGGVADRFDSMTAAFLAYGVIHGVFV